MSEEFCCYSCLRVLPNRLLHSVNAGNHTMCKTCFEKMEKHQRRPGIRRHSRKHAKEGYQKGVTLPWMYT